MFWLFAPLLWLLVLLLPGKHRRWWLIRHAARWLLRLSGIPLKVAGLENLPVHGACVIVANHASYLDGLVLAAALPVDLRFVAKAELNRQRIPGIFLRRIGALFVERFTPEKSILDAKRTQKALQAGQSLLYFPEGMLRRSPGLLPFHMGAFVAAAEVGAPVVPVAIRGTRSLLRGDSWFPHRTALSVSVLPMMSPVDTSWKAKLGLRDGVRTRLLAHLGEPDLAGEAVSAVSS